MNKPKMEVGQVWEWHGTRYTVLEVGRAGTDLVRDWARMRNEKDRAVCRWKEGNVRRETDPRRCISQRSPLDEGECV